MTGNLNYFLINRRERWGLTLYGWLILVLFIFIFAYLGFRNLFGTLAPVQREKTNILVLEGFVNDYVLYDAMKEFKSNNYKLLIVTGAPLEYGDLLASCRNTARVAGMSLLRLGFDSTKLVMIGTDDIRNERTYNSAVRLRQWLVANRPDITAVNLMTMGVHGGRSRMLFRKALGDSVKVGIISVPNFYYGPDSWWKSSKGFRETMNEAIGYYYIKFFFHPGYNGIAGK